VSRRQILAKVLANKEIDSSGTQRVSRPPTLAKVLDYKEIESSDSQRAGRPPTLAKVLDYKESNLPIVSGRDAHGPSERDPCFAVVLIHLPVIALKNNG
jgi:hypothetical protein